MTKLTIHNVGHGQCISLLHTNGNTMLWDCGHEGGYRPSSFLPDQGYAKIDYFFVTNFDEDHISDLPNLRQTHAPRILLRNKSISSAELRALKLQSGPITNAMASMLQMMDQYCVPASDPLPSIPDVSYTTYENAFGNTYSDTNNISLVTFLDVGTKRFIIPGDVELSGWEGLLAQPGFKDDLREVDVFVASHHGRESGYCKEVFDWCNPEVVIFSDSNIKHATQEMTNTYASHASGVQFNGETRKVLTTRNDGSLTWSF